MHLFLAAERWAQHNDIECEYLTKQLLEILCDIYRRLTIESNFENDRNG